MLYSEIQHVVDIITRLISSQYEHVLKNVVCYNTLYMICLQRKVAYVVAKNALKKYKVINRKKVPPKETAEDHLHWLACAEQVITGLMTGLTGFVKDIKATLLHKINNRHDVLSALSALKYLVSVATSILKNTKFSCSQKQP